MPSLRYYDAGAKPRQEVVLKSAIHTEFLRTGRINRRKTWDAVERRYLTHQEVAERTSRRLQKAGEVTHDRINAFHKSIHFPKLIFNRTLEESPHLGYCHVTAAHTNFAQFSDVQWAFYIANFFCDFGTDEQFFESVRLRNARMYFAVAMEPASGEGRLVINRRVRGNGVLFRTSDPKVAMKNVLLLGARNEELRRIIRSL